LSQHIGEVCKAISPTRHSLEQHGVAQKINSSLLSRNLFRKDTMKTGFGQLGQRAVSRYFYQKAFEHFKAIKQNEVYQNALWYLFFGTWCDEDSDNLLLCR